MLHLPEHSPVGGSSMERWHKDRCPGSVAASTHYPPLTSYEAEKGTAAHLLGETCLKTGLSTIDYQGYTFNDIPVDDEMIVCIQAYIDFIRSIIKANPGTEILVEHKFHCPDIHELFYGVMDTLLINRSMGWAHIIDLKYGRVPVPIMGCMQTKYYSVPLILDVFSEIQRIGNTIFQPRLYSSEPPYQTVWYSPAEIDQWMREELYPSIDLALSDNAPRKPGEHCRYCPAKLDCPEFRAETQLMMPPFPATNEQVAWTVLMKGVFKELIEDAEKEAAARLMLGEILPGLKPVRSYGKSAIFDKGGCAGELLTAGFTVDQIYENKLRGIMALSTHKKAVPIVAKYKQQKDLGIKALPMSSTKPAVAIPTQCFSKG